MSRLRSLRHEDLAALADPRVVARGRECVRWGLLSDLSERPGVIEARVAERRGQSVRVVVREGSRGLVTACTCSAHVDHGETCKHIVAALVAWISRRDGGASASAAAGPAADAGAVLPEAIHSLRSLIRLVKAGEAGPLAAGRPAAAPREEPAGPEALLAALLPRDVPVRVRVRRGGHTHGLVVSFHRDDAALPRRRRRAATRPAAPSGGAGGPGAEAAAEAEPAIALTIPPGDVAAALRELDHLDDVAWSDDADALRVYYSPVRMRLRADYARDGVLVLTPIAQTKETRGAARIIEPVHLHEGLDGTMWVEDGPDTLRRVGLWTSLIERYAPDFRPRVLEGAEVVEFLSEGQDGGWRGGVEPSDRVRASRVFADVRLARVEVSEAPGGWLWLDPVYRAGDHAIPLAEVLQAQREGGLLRRGDDWIVIRKGAAWTKGGRLKVEGEPVTADLAAEVVPDGATLVDGRIRTNRLAYLRQRAEWGAEVEIRADPALARFEAYLRREGPPPRAPHVRGMIGRLRPYQVAGYRWLWFLRESGLGGILADEMGLGKTHQVMALLLAAHGDDVAGTGPGPVGASGPDHGAATASPEAPGPAPQVAGRSGAAERSDAEAAATLLPSDAAETPHGEEPAPGGPARGTEPRSADVPARRPSLVVCPRSVLDHWEAKVRAHAPALDPLVYHGHERERDRETLLAARLVLTTYGVLARDVEPLASIPWEHVVLDEAQSIKNAATKAARAARKIPARHRLALTGTPIENHVEELRSIVDFVLPGYLGSAEWFRRRFVKPIEEGDAHALEVLKRAIDPFKLRRLKSQVLSDLPAKIEDERRAALTPAQAGLYREILAQAKASGVMEALGDRSRSVDFVHVFAVLSRLKRLCDHPALVVEGRAGRHLHSGKFEIFKELLGEALDAGEKVVVFSQYLEMLDLIEEHIDTLGVKRSGLRGATRRRGAAIRVFQEDPECRVFVASLLAGGLGVDLTAGSVVIHYDRWWNAAREDQATDRVHRIGQSRGVQVFRLITRGTLEERIDAIIREKRRLAESLVEADPALALKSLSRDELLAILQPPEAPEAP